MLSFFRFLGREHHNKTADHIKQIYGGGKIKRAVALNIAEMIDRNYTSHRKNGAFAARRSVLGEEKNGLLGGSYV